jgi:hypothetical protein
MSLFKRETRQRLNDAIDAALAKFADEPVTNAQVVHEVLEHGNAREIVADEYDAVICLTLRPMVQAKLAKGTSAFSAAPMLIPGLVLPYRIAAPHRHDPGADDDEQATATWFVLHLSTLGDLRRHISMREALIRGSLHELAPLKEVLDTILEITDDENAVLGEILSVPA